MRIQDLVLFGMLLFPEMPAEDKPLPELDAFVAEARKHLRSDRLLLSQYSYTQTETERRLNKDGSIKKVEVTMSEIYPSFEEDLTYERVISRNGKPLPAGEIEKRDREYDRKLDAYRRKLEKEGQNERAKRLAKEAEEKRKEDAAIDEAFRLYRFEMVGRERWGDLDTILLTFKARPDYKPKSREAKFLSKIAGRAWVAEDTHHLVRIEVELIDNVSLGFGLLARLNKGAKGLFERRFVNGEVWLPAAASFSGTGRVLLLKGIRVDVEFAYSDYRKYSVETRVGKGEIRSQYQP